MRCSSDAVQMQEPPQSCSACNAKKRQHKLPPAALWLGRGDRFGNDNAFRWTPVDVTCTGLLLPSVLAYPKVKYELPSRID